MASKPLEYFITWIIRSVVIRDCHHYGDPGHLMDRIARTKRSALAVTAPRGFARRRYGLKATVDFEGSILDLLFSESLGTFYVVSDESIAQVGKDFQKTNIKIKSKSKISYACLRKDEKVMAIALENGHIEIADCLKRKVISSFDSTSTEKVIFMKYIENNSLMLVTETKCMLFDNLGCVLRTQEFEETARLAIKYSPEFILLEFNGRFSLLECSSLLFHDIVIPVAEFDFLTLYENHVFFSCGGQIFLQDIDCPTDIKSFIVHSKAITSINVAKEGKFAISASLDGFVKLTSILSGKSKSLIDVSSGILKTVLNGLNCIGVVSSDGKFRVYSCEKRLEEAADKVAGPSVFKSVTSSLRKFKFRSALQKCIECSSPALLLNVLTMLNYNGFLKTAIEGLEISDRLQLLRRLKRFSVKSLLNPTIIEALKCLSLTMKDIHMISSLKSDVEYFKKIQRSFLDIGSSYRLTFG